jgi:glucose-1-phosphate thymidylyltransferase
LTRQDLRVAKRLLLVPAGGTSIRMGGLLKELLPVGARTSANGSALLPAPILSHAFAAGLAAGVDAAVVVTSASKAPLLMEAIAALELPIPVVYAHQPTPSGLGAAVVCAADQIRASEETLLLMPDTILRPASALAEAVGRLRDGRVVVATLHRAARPERFGVATIDGVPHVLGFVDKPRRAASPWVWTSIAFTNAFLRHVEHVRPVTGEWGLTEALDHAARAGALGACFVEEGTYHDVGTYEDYLAALADPTLSQPR